MTTLTLPLSASLAGSLIDLPVKHLQVRWSKLLNACSVALAMFLVLPPVVSASLHAINMKWGIINNFPMHAGCYTTIIPVKFIFVLLAVLLSIALPSVANVM
ncbi:hypothetical protein EDD16DRAFT_1515785 [Pisolithus croceorrhizus]|nr:hypothetical protein EDD16DRAFT_1515785 [Pisolithus croceorrhizus]KAI6129949.1 hypothetical protein EV401DRAFT_1884595 [Pisolithus croceorrhizus]KAI6166564.1 hypothetical protein EDD17DRAFT_1893781 [Pisolithus thermaeus]